MNYLRYIKQVLSRKQIISLILLSIGLIFVSIIELFGMSLVIPIIYTLTSDNFYNELITLLKNYNFMEISKKNILIISLALFAFAFLLKNFLLAIFFWFEGKFIHNMSEKISSKIFKKFLLKDYSFHLNQNSAHLMSKINNDLVYIKSFFLSLLTFISEIIIFLGLLSVLLYYSSDIFFKVTPILLFLLLLFYFHFNKIIKKIGKERKKNDFLKTKKIQESIGGIKEIIAFDRVEYFSKTYNNYINKLMKVFYTFHFLQKLPRIYFESITIIGIITFSTLILFTTNNIDNFVAILSVFIAFSLRLLPSINRIINSLNSFRYCLPAFRAIAKEMNFKIKKKNKFKVTEFKELYFKNIVFEYSKKDYKINLNLNIKSGQKIAIIGESGSGKSTFLDLIMGFHSTFKGNIYLNKRKVSTENLSGLFSYVPQFVYIFDDTILNNITLGKYEAPKNFDLLNQSLKHSLLDKFIKKRNNNLNTYAGDRGSRLSGGQKQRLGIARALYNNTPILILDEITSSLDDKTSKKIVNELINNKQKTIIFSTHNTELVKKFDKVYKISNGKLYVQKNI